MAHGDPRLWWTLDADRKACVIGALAADGLDAQAKSRKGKRQSAAGFFGIRGLEPG